MKKFIYAYKYKWTNSTLIQVILTIVVHLQSQYLTISPSFKMLSSLIRVVVESISADTNS